MYRPLLRLFGVILLSLPPLAPAHDFAPEPAPLVQRVAFGSCSSPFDETPVWQSVIATSPDVWIWLGDTIYADSPRPVAATASARARIVLDRMPEHYAALKALPAYAELAARARVVGTWDDHDYGQNDAGADFVGREEAQRHFLDFYNEPADSPRRSRPGIHASHLFGPPGRVVQIITLDTRSFRSPLPRAEIPRTDWVEGRPGTYEPVTDPAATLLGEDQWRWLEACLRQPADLRLLVSSIQVVADDHRFEKWGNFPHERRRLFKLIRETKAAGVLILSGDRHAGELSLLDPAREPDGHELDPGYPLHDLTSSALTKSSPTSLAAMQQRPPARLVTFWQEINRHRIGGRLPYNHFGLLEIAWDAPEGPLLTLSLRLDNGAEVIRHRIPLSALRPAR
jgi:alkaline phosphatase D